MPLSLCPHAALCSPSDRSRAARLVLVAAAALPRIAIVPLRHRQHTAMMPPIVPLSVRSRLVFVCDRSSNRLPSPTSLSARSLLEKHQLATVDVLLIDTEGHDYKILSQFFEAGIEPAVVNLEVLHLGRDERLALRRDLEAHGYAYQDYAYDTFAIKASFME